MSRGKFWPWLVLLAYAWKGHGIPWKRDDMGIDIRDPSSDPIVVFGPNKSYQNGNGSGDGIHRSGGFGDKSKVACPC